MEPSFFKEMPRFKNPEEELDYLRAHVKAREEQLINMELTVTFGILL